MLHMFLQSLLVFSVFLLASGSDEQTNGERREAQIIILGAGMAGINAARTLFDAGMTDFLVLEGTGNIGGRMRTFTMMDGNENDIVLEEGAHWITGSTELEDGFGNNPIYDLANDVGLLYEATNWSSYIVFDENSNVVTDPAVLGSFDGPRSCLTNKSLELYDRALAQEIAVDQSVRTTLKSCGWDPQTPVDNVLEWYDIDWSYAVSADSQGTVAYYDDRYDFWKDDDLKVNDQRGYKYIAEVLAEPFMEKIVFNSKVEKISYGTDGVTVMVNRQISQPTYTWASEGSTITSSFEEYTADFAIMTFSTGVLGRSIDRSPVPNVVDFEPSLPEWKKDAIDSSPMAFYSKLFLSFTEQFWDDTEIILRASFTRGAYPSWQNLNAISVFEDSNVLEVRSIKQLADDLSIIFVHIIHK